MVAQNAHSTITTQHRGRRRAFVGALVLLLITALLASCTQEKADSPAVTELQRSGPVVALASFDNCDNLLDAVKPALSSTVEEMWRQTSGADGGAEFHVDAAGDMATAESAAPNALDDSVGMSSRDAAASQAPMEDSGATTAEQFDTDAAMAETSGDADFEANLQPEVVQNQDDSEQATHRIVGTNVQEEGVDEPDVVKTNGEIMVVVRNNELRIYKVGENPTELSRFNVDVANSELASSLPVITTDSQIYLRDDDVIVISRGQEAIEVTPTPGEPQPVEPFDGGGVSGSTRPSEAPAVDVIEPDMDMVEPGFAGDDAMGTSMPAFHYGRSTVLLSRVSISDPAAPELLEQRLIEGDLVDSRMTNGAISVVVQSYPDVYNQLYEAGTMDAATTVIEDLDVEVFMPVEITADGDQPLGDCDDLYLEAVGQPEAAATMSAIGESAVGATADSDVTTRSDAAEDPSEVTDEPDPSNIVDPTQPVASDLPDDEPTENPSDVPSDQSDVVDPPAPDVPDTPILRAPATEAISVVTFGESLSELAVARAFGQARTVYGSQSAIYVASDQWIPNSNPEMSWMGTQETVIHRFALEQNGAVYTGTGTVPGWLINQFAMSEHNGVLRVATTVETYDEVPVPQGDVGVSDDAVSSRDIAQPEIMMMPQSHTESRVTTLDAASGDLRQLGVVDGLGPDETIHSVRYIGDLGYVVTFRQTDPLYAIDLSDPAAPRVLGELKITGFSEYLHPIGTDLLVGIGREVDPNTLRDEGMKVSVFNIGDPTQLVEQTKLVISDVYSSLGQEHRTLLWDSLLNRMSFPVHTMNSGGQEFLMLNVTPQAISEITRVTHGPGTSVYRGVIIDDQMWTVSENNIGHATHDDPSNVTLLGP